MEPLKYDQDKHKHLMYIPFVLSTYEPILKLIFAKALGNYWLNHLLN